MNYKELLTGLFNGESSAASRLITMAENRSQGLSEAMKEIYKHTGNAHIIGITGAPGVGKSTLTGKLVKAFRALSRSVGVIAIDPSSPFTGGALLGDRIRMADLVCDREVFIRSMGTRGGAGGLAVATNDAISILDAFKKDIIIVETIGVGQDEIEIDKFVHTLVVVTMPGGGDAVQCVKAGILEIGDIYAVNKADHPEAQRAVADIEFMIQLKKVAENKQWKPPVVMTVAIENRGIDILVEKIKSHYNFLVDSGIIKLKYIQRVRAQIMSIIENRLSRRAKELLSEKCEQYKLIFGMSSEDITDPYTAADLVIRQLCSQYMNESAGNGNELK